jgi:two-component system nitrogen regulation sensor histidine kinase NtrY
VQTAFVLGLVVLGPLLALLTYLLVGPLEQGGQSPALRLIILADIIYVMVLSALVLLRVVNIISQRRAVSEGSRLHLRLTAVFTMMALLPTITVAVFAMLSVNLGLEAWFSDRVQQVIEASRSAAKAYQDEHREGLIEDGNILASQISAQMRQMDTISDGRLREILSQGQLLIQRGLREAYILDETGEIRARGDKSYLFDLEKPTPAQFETANAEGLLTIPDWQNDEYRVLIPLKDLTETLYLYISREVQGDLLRLLDDAQQEARFYQQNERDRGKLLFDFGLFYLAFALLMIMASIWLALWFAERLSRPIGRLAGAAQAVGEGNLDIQVPPAVGDDEITLLGRYFNQMTRQLKAQREDLVATAEQIERRRRMFDSVLSSVTSGVVGLDQTGAIAFVNRSAERLMDWHEEQNNVALAHAIPEFSHMFEELRTSGAETSQQEIKVIRRGAQENLLVRMAPRRSETGSIEGYVIAFDDVTDLVSAQRSAAWGDVARRIAHEIKNPLTPIQLSAERISRKFRKVLGEEDAATLGQLTSVIVRQTDDLRHIVDEFSKFARMPEPERKMIDIVGLVKSSVLLQEAGQPEVQFDLKIQDETCDLHIDETMISQALTNLLKNAGEAIEARLEKANSEGPRGEIRIDCTQSQTIFTIAISDNGTGLPVDRAKLFEPYVTTRDKGTGLGLPIVKKIIEEHGGTLKLEDAEVFDKNERAGARVIVELPLPSSGQVMRAIKGQSSE